MGTKRFAGNCTWGVEHDQCDASGCVLFMTAFPPSSKNKPTTKLSLGLATGRPPSPRVFFLNSTPSPEGMVHAPQGLVPGPHLILHLAWGAGP